MKKFILFFLIASGLTNISNASPIISGISTNEIEIDTKFQGAKILLFGAKGDAGNIIVAVRGPKKNFIVTKKRHLLGIWLNGDRVEFKETTGFYSLFSTFNNRKPNDDLLAKLKLGKHNLDFNSSNDIDPKTKSEFQLQLVDKLEKKHLYNAGANEVDFLDETLFKVMLDFPKNISRGVYSVEIYLVSDGSLLSFQSIPIYVNQAGFSAKVLDFSHRESFYYGLLSVALALIVGWIANVVFVRFIGK